jgi:hypothetical protein
VWCSRDWPVICENSQLVLESFQTLGIPKDLDNAIDFFRRLARDYPIVMEFVPSVKVLTKLIERAA